MFLDIIHFLIRRQSYLENIVYVFMEYNKEDLYRIVFIFFLATFQLTINFYLFDKQNLVLWLVFFSRKLYDFRLSGNIFQQIQLFSEINFLLICPFN